MADQTTGWPYDADRDDPLTARRIPVTCSHPQWCYLVSFDRESEARPTKRETALLVSYLEQYIDHWYRPWFREKLAERPFDIDGGANGVVFHKFGENDWGYRRRSYERGYLFTVVWPRQRATVPPGPLVGPFSLLALMDRMHTICDKPGKDWVAWKADHPDVFKETDRA